MAIKFGAAQLKNPTPTKWSNAIQIFTVIAAALLAWIGTAAFIPASLSSVLQSILGLMITVANGLKPFLGVDTRQRTVDIDDVSAMDEPKTFSKPAAPNDTELQNKP